METYNYSAAVPPITHSHHLYLEILHFAARLLTGFIYGAENQFVFQSLFQIFTVKRRSHALLIVLIDIFLNIALHYDVIAHAVRKITFSLRAAQNSSAARIQVKIAHQTVIKAKRLYHFVMQTLLAHFALPLLRNVEQETLVKQFTVLLDDLYIAHYMKLSSAHMLYAILHANAVALAAERFYPLAQHFLVIIDDG